MDAPASATSLEPLAWQSSVHECWAHGRKVLIILGAGASASAKIPVMREVYRALHERVHFIRNLAGTSSALPHGTTIWQKEILAILAESPAIPDRRRSELSRLDRLLMQLAGLAKDAASRSIASMALGDLQNAHREIGEDDRLPKLLAAVWGGFARDFLDNNLTSEPNRKPLLEIQPQAVHRWAASWACEGKATVISLNFDGLTYRAIGAELNKEENASAVVLTHPEDVENFYLGGRPLKPDLDPQGRFVPVIKVWGDVFHAACANPRCPEYNRPVPIYRMQPPATEGSDDTGISQRVRSSAWLQCPNCHQTRQLQIHFTGYAKKEELTQDLIRSLHRYVTPEIGAVICVGFSGLWDSALVEYIAKLGRDLQGEFVGREWANPGSRQSTARVIVVDTNPDAFLIRNLRERRVKLIALTQNSALQFAAQAGRVEGKLGRGNPRGVQRYTAQAMMSDGVWTNHLRPDPKDERITGILPGTYKLLFDGTDYLPEFARLRQLGIKTRAALCRQQLSVEKIFHGDDSEKMHNRRDHSIGAAHLAAYWYKQLHESAERIPGTRERYVDGNRDYLASIAFFAALHHDVGHVPFTHLTEEIFGDIRYTLQPWSDGFHHDQPVLGDIAEPLENIDLLLDGAAQMMGVKPDHLINHLEMAIQGRSGYPWLDAILNSPLDVDKIDYIYRDCNRLAQGLHLNTARLSDAFSSARRLFDNSFVLPSGIVALAEDAGEFARELLEERFWLYRNQYLHHSFRVIERIASVVILQWVTRATASKLAAELRRKQIFTIEDTSTLKGRAARDLLWHKLRNLPDKMYGDEWASALPRESYGECELLLQLAAELKDGTEIYGIAHDKRAREWFARAHEVFVACLDPRAKLRVTHEKQSLNLATYLRDVVKVTTSDRLYLRHEDLPKARKIAREIETTHYMTAFFDFAVTPRVLSYPSRRRFDHHGKQVSSECFAVSHEDPDRWGKLTDKWVPLSLSAFASREKDRWVKLMVVSPFEGDPHVRFLFDAFRARCRAQRIDLLENDPEL